MESLWSELSCIHRKRVLYFSCVFRRSCSKTRPNHCCECGGASCLCIMREEFRFIDSYHAKRTVACSLNCTGGCHDCTLDGWQPDKDFSR
jgi:hypothetical protein